MPKAVVRSMLYIPGNNPGMIQQASVFGADSILLDLEDAVALSEKDAARHLVCGFLRTLDFGDMLVTVRVNGADTPFFAEDLRRVVPCRPDAIRLPKCSSPEDVRAAEALLAEIEAQHGMEPGTVKIHAMLETARGIAEAGAVATCSPRVTALTLGGQDLTADMGVEKTREGDELFVARSLVALAARAAGIDAFDTIWADVNDNEGLLEETRRVVGLGFTGKAAIHPGQISWIHRAFVPDAKKVAAAERIAHAAAAAEREGRGVVSVDGRMVDAPVVRRARHTLDMARLAELEVE
jgi:citrate lyase subunit beta/citryl-CoA lyase